MENRGPAATIYEGISAYRIRLYTIAADSARRFSSIIWICTTRAVRCCWARLRTTPPPAPAQASPAIAATAARLAGPALVALALAVYANTWSAPLVFDDFPAIRDNPTIRSLPDGWSPPTGSGLPVSGRPLPNFTLAVNYAVSGLEVWSYHLLNLTIHAATALVLFGLTRRTLQSPRLDGRTGTAARPLAWLAAAAWLAHPLAVEAVTYITQRTEALMAFFFLLTLWAFARGLDSARGAWWRGFSVGACALGMMCKEVMVAAPLMVLLYDRTFASGTLAAAWRRHWRYYLALAGTWLLLAGLVISTAGRGGTAGFATEVSAGAYVATQCFAIPRYLALAAWPAPLVFDYGTAVVRDPALVVPGALIVLALAAGSVVALRRRSALGFCGAAFFAVLAPSSSVVPIATQTMAEHRMYLPLALVMVLFVVGLYRWLGRAGWFLAGAAITVLGLATLVRNADYRSNEALWRDTVAKRPLNARAHCSLADALFVAGQADAAIPYYQEALRLKPDYGEALVNLGCALLALDRPRDAVEPLESALRLQPSFGKTHHNLANALARSGREADALAHYAAAAKLKPADVTTLCDWGNALQRSGDTGGAVSRYDEAIRREPGFAMAHNNLANALAESGRLAEAIPHYEAALRLEPNSAEGHNNFGSALAQSERFTEAIRHYEIALRLRPDYPQAHENLGKVYLALGDDATAQREFALARRGPTGR